MDAILARAFGRVRYFKSNDDDDNGFGSTVRYAPGVTKVRYRKIIYLKKPKIELEKQQKKTK